MVQLEIGKAAEKQHGPLVQRVGAIVHSLFGTGRIELRDADDASPVSSKARVVELDRSGLPGIRQIAENIVRVSYNDAASETALAQLIAAMARSGDPLAADPESLSIFALAERLAASDIPVLIGGPTGTGKEVLARFLHSRSSRADGPFIAVNCAAMPEAMLEAMLFGHQKGAFTGATQAHEGFMRAAEGGTLLLDEIAEMPLALQSKLLRALQEGEVVPIGSTQPIPLDVRIIASANRDLPLEVSEGRFRADLFYRLNVFPLTLKPLQDRPQDIAPLAYGLALRHTLAGQTVPSFKDSALTMLKLHGWPGNVRELENVVRRALLLADGSQAIGAEHIIFDDIARLVDGPAETAAASNGKLSSIVQRSEARAILETLEGCGGNRSRAAKALGISERTLRYRLASFRDAGIEVTRTAAGGRQ